MWVFWTPLSLGKLREVTRMWLTTSENPTRGAMVETLKSPVIEEVCKETAAKELLQWTATC